MQELQESVDKNKAKMEEVKRGMLCNNYSDWIKKNQIWKRLKEVCYVKTILIG